MTYYFIRFLVAGIIALVFNTIVWDALIFPHWSWQAVPPIVAYGFTLAFTYWLLTKVFDFATYRGVEWDVPDYWR